MLSLIKAATVVFMIYVRDFGRSILIEHNNNKSCFMINAHASMPQFTGGEIKESRYSEFGF
jgi:hypothetical protein